MAQLSTDVLAWVRAGFPDGVADSEAAALAAILQERMGTEATHDLLRRLAAEGVLGDAALRALVPEESEVRTVSAKLALGGWPLGGAAEDEDDTPREGSPLARIVHWLREGYPGGVPEHDYLPLLALLERRLTRSEVKKVAKALRKADVSPAGPEDIAAMITSYTHTDPSRADLQRVRDQLAKKGWPTEFPDPEI